MSILRAMYNTRFYDVAVVMLTSFTNKDVFSGWSKITIFCDFSYIRIPHLKKFFWVEIFFWVCPNCASENFLIFFSHPTLKNYNSTTASGKIFMLFIHNHKYFRHNIIYFGSFSLIASAPTAPAKILNFFTSIRRSSGTTDEFSWKNFQIPGHIWLNH